MPNNLTKTRPSEWWLDEDGLFNLDEEGRAEKQQCAVAASNIIRNFSFMPDNEVIMAQHRHCLETVFQCIENYVTGENCFLKIIFMFQCIISYIERGSFFKLYIYACEICDGIDHCYWSCLSNCSIELRCVSFVFVFGLK